MGHVKAHHNGGATTLAPALCNCPVHRQGAALCTDKGHTDKASPHRFRASRDGAHTIGTERTPLDDHPATTPTRFVPGLQAMPAALALANDSNHARACLRRPRERLRQLRTNTWHCGWASAAATADSLSDLCRKRPGAGVGCVNSCMGIRLCEPAVSSKSELRE